MHLGISLKMNARGGGLGPELVTDPSFANAGADWSKVNDVVFATGSATLTGATGSAALLFEDIGLAVGSNYRAQVTVNSLAGTIDLISSNGDELGDITSNGTAVIDWTHPAGANGQFLIRARNTGDSGVVTFASVKEL